MISYNSKIPLFVYLSISLLICGVLTADDKLVWHTSLQVAKKEAAKTKKPIFLQFRCAP